MIAGSSYQQALPWTEDKRAVLDELLGAGTYRIEQAWFVERRGRWYEVVRLALYSGTPLDIYFSWPFPHAAPQSVYPVRTAFAADQAAVGNPGVLAVIIGAGLLAAGYALTRKERRR